MSNETKVPVWSWRDAVRKADVPTLTKALCWALANYMSDAGEACWPSMEALQADTGMSERSITTHLGHAKRAQLLDAKRARDARGYLGPYKFHPRFPDNHELPKAIPAKKSGFVLPAPSAPRRETLDASGAEPRRTKCATSNISISELSKKETRERAKTDDTTQIISQATRQQIELMGVDPDGVIDRIKKSKSPIKNLNAYALTAAKREASERLGVSEAVVARMASSDMQTRAQAMVAAVVSSTSPKPHTARPSSALLASLGRAA